VTLSVVIITYNEEANLRRTLASIQPLLATGECIVLDSGSTDGTYEIARAHGAKVFCEPWKGFAAQKNSAIAKAAGDWLLSLDADEALEPGLASEIQSTIAQPESADGYFIPRKNYFLGRWMRHGGYWPDPKLRLFRRGAGRLADRLVHESVQVNGRTGRLQHALLHDAYPTLEQYLDTMNRYSSLAADMTLGAGPRGFSLWNIVLRPLATFVYNYIFRLGFLDGREGLLLHLYHSGYVSWKYAKAWQASRRQ
jgi:glycosyltransferase involved in cell wall biosynthesis